MDINYSPLEGWSLFKHVRIGCFTVEWDKARITSFIEKADEEWTSLECADYCNKTQAYFRRPQCRCGKNEDDILMTEVIGGCTGDSWEVFREYDYRSSMSPSTYDVARRLLYQIVTLRVPHVENPIRYFIHAVNAFEAKPKFEFDTRLDRMIFNAVWDFGKSRMVSLSFEDFGSPLDFTIVQFNYSTGSLVIEQDHYPIQQQISAVGSLLGEGLASVDGLSTVDILFGTYYTVVPAMLPESTQVVHIIVAIDIDKKKVINSLTLPVTLMNMQINALGHVLYGAGAPLSLPGQYMYYQLCEAFNVTETIDDVTQVSIRVDCELRPMARLPASVEHMYLQSATIDHQFNFAWFTFKEEASGNPRVFEFHHDDVDYLIWKKDALPLDAAFTSLIQTAPRIIYALYPPTLKYAKFSPTGTKIFCKFDAPTLRGAKPVDTDGNEIPDTYYPEDKMTRGPCELFFDDFTMRMIPNSMCEWTSDEDIIIEITVAATIVPGDLVRIRPATVFAGKMSPSGVYQFSQPSTDFAVVEVPDEIPIPVVQIVGSEYIDVCTEFFLDGSPSYGHGFRGTFIWKINVTEPRTSEPHMRHVQKLLDNQPKGQSQQVIRLEPGNLLANKTYYFSLTVVSFWDSDIFTTKIRPVRVSAFPVPSLFIYGAPEREIPYNSPVALVSYVEAQGGCMPRGEPSVRYWWTGCRKTQLRPTHIGLPGCPQNPRWDNETFTLPGPSDVSGVDARSLLIKQGVLQLFETYVFTVFAEVRLPGDDAIYENQASVEVRIVLSDMVLTITGGNGFSAPYSEAIVVDTRYSPDESDPLGLVEPFFNYSCEYGPERKPCPLLEDRRLVGVDDEVLYYEPEQMEYVQCVDALDSEDEPTEFFFRGHFYNDAVGITDPNRSFLSPTQRYCMSEPGVLIFQRWAFEPGEYIINVNMSKYINGIERTSSGACYITVTPETEAQLRDEPIVNISMESLGNVIVTETQHLEGWVTNARNDTNYEYVWSLYRWGANRDWDIDLAQLIPDYNVPKYAWGAVDKADVDFTDPSIIRTPIGSRYLVTIPNVFKPNVLYKLRLTVYDETLLAQGDAVNAVGFAEVVFLTKGLAPSGGQLLTSNLTGFAFETIFKFNMRGWGTDDIPITYQFGYNDDPNDPYNEVTMLNSMFGAQRLLDTVLPPGKVMPSNQLQVIGYCKSGIGSVATSTLTLSVKPPRSEEYVERMNRSVLAMDPEYALSTAVMLAQYIQPGETEALQELYDRVEFRTSFRTMPPQINGSKIVVSPQTVSLGSQFLTIIATKGLLTWTVLETLQNLQMIAETLGFLIPEESFGGQGTNVAYSLLSTVDSIIPGIYAKQAESRGVFETIGRRLPAILSRPLQALGGHRARALTEACIGLQCGIEAEVTLDNRSKQDQFLQMEAVRVVERLVGHAVVKGLTIGEIPVSFNMRGHDFYMGKTSKEYNEMARDYSEVMRSFSVPTLFTPGTLPESATVVYNFLQFKKYPFVYMDLPEQRRLGLPATVDEPKARRVPKQTNYVTERLWHAMSLELTDPDGNPLEEQLQNSLVNATFGSLPRLEAYHMETFGTRDNAATCFYVDHGNKKDVNTTNFSARGLLYAEGHCVTTHLSDFAVFIDNLVEDLELFEEVANWPSCLWTGFQECPIDVLTPFQQVKTTAMVSSNVLILILALAAAAVGVYIDNKESDVWPIDNEKRPRHFATEDKKEKTLAALSYAFRRNHLLVGLAAKHRRFDRQRRVLVLYLVWILVKALVTVMHSKLEFHAADAFVATGIMAGIVAFPIIQMVIAMFEWRPDEILRVSPPMALPPRSIPLRESAHPAKVTTPLRPPVPTSIKRPPPLAPPRVALPPHLSLPVVKPGPPPVPGQVNRRFPPPKRPSQKPMPPPGPPPKNHLTAVRGRDKVDALPGMPELLALPQIPGQAGQIMIRIPELPKLSMQAAKSSLAKAPKPPAKPPSDGPRPPRAPPPLQKMYFTVPKAPLRVPPLPPERVAEVAKGPTLPPLPVLPKLTRPSATFGGTLSMIKTGDGPVPGPPPPPPPPKAAKGEMPIAPSTPREGMPQPMELPGSVLGPEWGGERPGPPQPPLGMLDVGATLSGALTPPMPPETPPDGSSLAGDSEAFPPPTPPLSEDPEHAMAPSELRGGNPRGPRPPPVPPPPKGDGHFRMPELPNMQQSRGGPGTPGAQMPPSPPVFQPPHVAPPYAPPSRVGQSNLPPLVMNPRGGPPQRLPALPKLQLPSAIFSKVPQIQQHPPGIVPPPPPPPLEEAALVPIPPPPAGAKGVNVRQLQDFRGAGALARVVPKPPAKRPQQHLLPTPPVGPPPAHAIILAKRNDPKAGPPPDGLPRYVVDGKPVKGAASMDLDEIRKGVVRPPPLPKPPPTAALPSFVHKGVQKAPVAGKDVSADEARHILEMTTWQPELVPVRDVVVFITKYAALFVVLWLCGTSLFAIVFFGTYLDDSALFATHGATIIGCIVDVGIFESVKCIVLAAIDLVKDETQHRTTETAARRARMALKAQRLQNEGRWSANEGRLPKPPPPPIMG